MSLTLRQLRYFVAVAQFGKISQAATELSISQSAITTSIRELEMSVGTPLFSRLPHGMELTKTGRQFLAHAYDVLNKVDEALGVGSVLEKISGTISVAATYTVIGYFLPPHLKRLKKMYPDLTINIHEITRRNIELGLVKGDYDIAVLLTSNIHNQDIGSEPLISSYRRLWVCHQHPLLERPELSLADISGESYVMLTIDEAANTSLQYWKKSKHRPNVILRTSSVEAVRSMVANGQGVTILSDMVYRPWSLEGKRIETATLSDQIPTMNVGLGWKRGAIFTPAMIILRNYFRGCFRDMTY